MVGPAEMARRGRGLVTHKLTSLPILALSVHSACNCRCVMCDIWKANAERREISAEEIGAHVAAIERLYVQRVMLTGGEPLLHRNLWALCDRLRETGVQITLVTTGLLAQAQAAEIARAVDTVVVSLDGPSEVHDAVRRVTGGFEKIVGGIAALRAQSPSPRLTARSVVQRANYAHLDRTIAAAHQAGFDELSFLAADVSSSAFNRAEPWPAQRQDEIAVPAEELGALKRAIDAAHDANTQAFTNGFVVGGAASLIRIYDHYRAVAGLAPFPKVRCNAPWVSAVLEPGGVLRPCFFHAPYARDDGGLGASLNSPSAVTFRRTLDVSSDDTCRRCVCSLNLPLTQTV